MNEKTSEQRVEKIVKACQEEGNREIRKLVLEEELKKFNQLGNNFPEVEFCKDVRNCPVYKIIDNLLTTLETHSYGPETIQAYFNRIKGEREVCIKCAATHYKQFKEQKASE